MTKRIRTRKNKDLRRVDRNSFEYWNEILRRHRLTIQQGEDPRLVYSPNVELIDGFLQGQGFTTQGGRHIRPKSAGS